MGRRDGWVGGWEGGSEGRWGGREGGWEGRRRRRKKEKGEGERGKEKSFGDKNCSVEIEGFFLKLALRVKVVLCAPRKCAHVFF